MKTSSLLLDITDICGEKIHTDEQYIKTTSLQKSINDNLANLSHSQETVAGDYDSIAPFFDDFPIAAQHGPTMFINKTPLSSNKFSALDVGCGTGRTVQLLAEHFGEVHGVDISRGMLEVASSRCSHLQNVQFHKANAVNLSFYEDNYFDYIVSHTTLHHLDEPELVIAEFSRILKPGGKIVIVDIVKKGLMGFRPDIVRRVGAFLNIFSSIFKMSLIEAFRLYKINTSKYWMSHLRRDRFLTRAEIDKRICKLLPGCKISFLKREIKLNTLFILEWEKVALPEYIPSTDKSDLTL